MNDREREEISELLLKLRANGLTQLLVEHNVHMMTSICDHLVAFDFGRKIAEGPPQEVIADPAVRQSYLGQVDP
jgi:ABC-type branched-subunit amino acid transport system ATPase component